MTENPTHLALAETRRKARQHLQHLGFLVDNQVDQALVKAALLDGLSQSDTAKLLGMSKKTVNEHSRRQFVPVAVAREMSADSAAVRDAFFRGVWGSDADVDAAYAAIARYDRERLHIEPI